MTFLVFNKKVAKNLGLPLPISLDRFESGQRLIRGSVLVGAATGEDNRVSQAIARIFSELHAEIFVNNNHSEICVLPVQ